MDVGGELKRWHPVTITFDGPSSSENAATNPFLDYRLTVTVTAPSGTSRVLPGFFAADGDAAQTSATSGNAWRVHFTPSEVGAHTFVASFRTGTDVAVNLDPDAGSPTGFDGATGSFTVAETNKSAPDFRGRGVLRSVGGHYLQFEDGSYFVKGGAGSPENFLAYYEFDNTEDFGGDNGNLPPDGLHHYDPHLGDWRSGDPTWQGGKGKRIIGAVNYLASEGVDVQYFLTANHSGDGKDVYPWVEYESNCAYDENCLRYDVSKLAQWDLVFRHMQAQGIALHVVLQERENDHLFGDPDGDLDRRRKLYYRELVARFGYHPALVWNLGEENTNSAAQIEDFSAYIRALDPYDHPIVLHTHPNEQDLYDAFLGTEVLDGASLQLSGFEGYDDTETWVAASAASGRPGVVTVAVAGGASDGCTPDGSGNNHDRCRGDVIWPNLFAGGAGVEWYFGYAHPHDDIDLEDFRSRDRLWDYTRHAVTFVEEHLPFTEMRNVPASSVGGDSDTHLFVEDASDGGWARAAAYFANGTDSFDLPEGTYTLSWFDPRNGGGLQPGGLLEGGASVAVGSPPSAPSEDWVVLLVRSDVPEAPNLNATPTALDFGAVVLGTTAPRALRLRNTGTQPLTVTRLALSGDGDFALVSPPSTPFTLGTGEEETLAVRFAPATLGPRAATLGVESNDPDTPLLAVPLTGTGVDEASEPSVLSFTLVDAGTDEDIGPLMDGATLDLSTLPAQLNLRANTNPEIVGSVRFDLNGDAPYAIENDAPYALDGDDGGDYRDWTLGPGTYVLTATPYAEADAGGESGLPLTIQFELSVATSASVPDYLAGLTVYPPRPNPTRADATFTFDLPDPAPVRLRLFDARGTQVAVLLDARLGAGRHTVALPLDRAASGLYLCRLDVGGRVFTEKVLVVR
ncbi:MAG: choice-of-anchor D domain-containing protein [Rubricoccaceae bacterium]|nr:choice-of-anchor D domain-containing protein [Rubricoccaceae bacterium]